MVLSVSSISSPNHQSKPRVNQEEHKGLSRPFLRSQTLTLLSPNFFFVLFPTTTKLFICSQTYRKTCIIDSIHCNWIHDSTLYANAAISPTHRHTFWICQLERGNPPEVAIFFVVFVFFFCLLCIAYFLWL